jgi:hypothetical protein
LGCREESFAVAMGGLVGPYPDDSACTECRPWPRESEAGSENEFELEVFWIARLRHAGLPLK